MNPRVLIGNARCAAKHPDALVVDLRERMVHGLPLRIHVVPQCRDVLAVLVLNMGHFVTHDQIYAAIWGHREDGGPNDLPNQISVHVWRLRKALEGSPYAISTTHCRVMISPVEMAIQPQRSRWPMALGQEIRA